MEQNSLLVMTTVRTYKATIPTLVPDIITEKTTTDLTEQHYNDYEKVKPVQKIATGWENVPSTP